MLYDKLTEVPTPGSPLESLILLVWRMRQDIRVAETRLLVNSVVIASTPPDQESNNHLREDWDGFVKSVFPFHTPTSKSGNMEAIEFLRQQVSLGPLSVKMIDPKMAMK